MFLCSMLMTREMSEERGGRSGGAGGGERRREGGAVASLFLSSLLSLSFHSPALPHSSMVYRGCAAALPCVWGHVSHSHSHSLIQSVGVGVWMHASVCVCRHAVQPLVEGREGRAESVVASCRSTCSKGGSHLPPSLLQGLWWGQRACLCFPPSSLCNLILLSVWWNSGAWRERERKRERGEPAGWQCACSVMIVSIFPSQCSE